MSGASELVVLALMTCLATFALDRLGRLGYGLVTGAEFLLVGIGLGPAGLDLLSSELLGRAAPLIALACAWLGFRFGLRFRASALRRMPWRVRLASQLEPLCAFASLWFLLSLADGLLPFPLPWTARVALAAVGSATTKSAVVWARSRHAAQGPITEAIEAVSSVDDLVGIAAVGALFAALHPGLPHLPSGLWTMLGLMAVLGGALGVLARLLTGRGPFRQDLAWVALLGLCALGCGLAKELDLSALAACSLFGLVVGRLSPHADAFDELTQSTERPVVQILLVLAGSWIAWSREVALAALLFALLRLLAKLASGTWLWILRTPDRPRVPWMGAGLFGGGGLGLAMAFSCATVLPSRLAQLVLGGCAAMVAFGDVLGSPALKLLLRRHGEIGARSPDPMGSVESAP